MRKSVAMAGVVAAGVFGGTVGTVITPISASADYGCATSSTHYTTAWISGSAASKYNVSRFTYLPCPNPSTGLAMWQRFVSSETRASRGCGGSDRWKVDTQAHFHNSTNVGQQSFIPGTWRYNDCPEASDGVRIYPGPIMVTGGGTYGMLAKVEQRCDTPTVCATFHSASSKTNNT